MKTKIVFFLLCSSMLFYINNLYGQQKATVKRETVSKNIRGRIEVKEGQKTYFQDVTLKVNYIKETYYNPDGTKIPKTASIYGNYPSLTIEKCSFLGDYSLYFTATCNDSCIYETNKIDLKDTDSNLQTYIWATVIIRFKCQDFFSNRSEI